MFTRVGVAMVLGCMLVAMGQAGDFETDIIETAEGDLAITFIGHGTLMFAFNERVVHVDPWGRLADYSAMPDADLVLITHEHRDHLDPEAVAAIRTKGTRVLGNAAACEQLEGCEVLANGQRTEVFGMPIEVVPAYNVVNMRSPGVPFHPKGQGNGYVIGLGGITVYVAGDTENTPEVKALEGIDVAFLPMNLPYTMTPEMVADAARAFRPKILYPYHYGDTDPETLVTLLADEPGIEVRVRAMQ